MSETAEPKPDAAATLVNQIKACKGATQEQQKSLKAVQKSLDALLARDALTQPSSIDRLRHSLAASSAALPGLAELLVGLEQHATALRHSARQELLAGLHAQAAAEQLTVELLSEQPLELLIAPLSVVVDFDRGRAALCFARETVLECPARAAAVWEQRRKALEAIRARGSDSAVFFEQLLAAYRMVLLRSGQPAGQWVEIVDVLAPLALAGLELKKWRALTPGKLPELTRYQLAYALHRLHRDGLLEHKGLRLELGTATGGSTRDKRNVLFVPLSARDGQYYLTLRFVASA